MAGIGTLKQVGCMAFAAGLLMVSGCSGSESSTDSGEVRVVNHAFGQSEIPVNAGRVAVLDGDRTLEAVVALGISPVAAVRPQLTGDYSPQVRERLSDEPIDIGGESGSVNREALLAADPDLIVMRTSHGDTKELFDQVSDIAPTVAVEYAPAQWKRMLTQLGEILDRDQLAQELLSDYNSRVAEVAMPSENRDALMSVVRIRSDGLRYMTQNGSFAWSVLRDVGYRAPQSQEVGSDDHQTVDISAEQVNLLSAPKVLLLSDADTAQATEALQANPLFVASEIIAAPSAGFMFGSILSAEQLLDIVSGDNG